MSDTNDKYGHDRPRHVRLKPPFVALMMDDYLPPAASRATGRQRGIVRGWSGHESHQSDWSDTFHVEPIAKATRTSIGKIYPTHQGWFIAGREPDALALGTRFHFAWGELESSLDTFAGACADSDLQRIFEELATRWKMDVCFESSVEKMAMHPAYQRIIGLGPSVIPLILGALSGEPDHWFWALQALTGENPVSEYSAGNIKLMAGEWQEWATNHGY